jgi:dTDP-glucose pyrophosphorylase/predicted transcriptional regulator
MILNSNYDWKKTLIRDSKTIQEALESLNNSGLQIVLVIDSNQKFKGTITDGDIRRGILKGLGIKQNLSDIVNKEALVVPPEISKDAVLHLMKANKLKHLPIVDSNGIIYGLHTFDNINEVVLRKNYFVVMAGGKGTRMRPFTENCPKPMLVLKDKPMLEHILLRAISDGFFNFIFCIHYLGEIILNYFGDGSKWGVNIQYLHEEKPLGTAGALSIMNIMLSEPFIVTNGDVITDIQYSDLIEYNNQHNAVATMAVREYILQHPFGVVNTIGVNIEGFEEKPNFKTLVNAGIYCLSPSTLNYIKKNEYLDMPTLFSVIKENGKKTIVYPMHETWMDIGKPVDLEIAKQKLN